MNQRLAALCIASFVFVCALMPTADAQTTAAESAAQNAGARSSGDSDTARSKRSTNTEKSDRDYQDEEIADAPPPPNRVRNRPQPR